MSFSMAHRLSQHPAFNEKGQFKYSYMSIYTSVFHFCLQGALSFGLQVMSFDFQLISSGFGCDCCERCPCASMLIRRHLFHRLALELIWKNAHKEETALRLNCVTLAPWFSQNLLFHTRHHELVRRLPSLWIIMFGFPSVVQYLLERPTHAKIVKE